ncbi:MAG: hypothetical protein FWG17_00385 [Desulfovibrionaceae bacterium]|nr:hypothetical protein [Desulfovibrionaceae bacterium]
MAQTTQNPNTATPTPTGRVVEVPSPAANQNLNIISPVGGILVLPFDASEAAFVRQGNDLVLEKDGGTVTMSDFFAVGDGSLPSLQLPDGAVISSADFLASMDIDVTTAAGDMGATGRLNPYNDDAGALFGAEGLDRLGAGNGLGGWGDGLGDYGQLGEGELDLGDPVALAIIAGNLDEATLGTAVTGTFSFNFGPDGPSPAQPFSWTQPADNQWTSHGESLIWEVSADGLTLTGHTGDINDPVIVFQATGAGADGIPTGYTIIQSKPLDHPYAGEGDAGRDIMNLEAGYVIRDFNGDESAAAFTVGVIDDVPVVVAQETPLELYEAGLAQGENPSTEGTLSLNFGADGPAGEGAFAWQAPTADYLSGGEEVAWKVSADGLTLTGYIIVDNEESTVIEIVGAMNNTNDELTYTITQYRPLDHPDPGADPLDLDFGYILTDYDGDTAAGTLTLTVIDDIPKGVNEAALSMNEADLASGPVTVGGNFTFDYGADGPAKDKPFSWDEVANQPAELKALASGGVQLTWEVSLDGLTLTGHTGDINDPVLVYQANLGADGKGGYTITLHRPLDHPDPGADPLDLAYVRYVLKDGDGDYSTGSVTLTVIDDVPTPSPLPDATLNEADIAAGLAVITGSLDLKDYGADGPFGANTWQVGEYSEAFHWVAPEGDFHSGGQLVEWAYNDNGQGMFGFINGDPSDIVIVFKMTSWDQASGAPLSYEITLRQPLDHPKAGDSNDPASRDPLELNVSYTLKDFDGDTNTGTLTVTVIDDVPTANPIVIADAFNEADLLVNGKIATEGVISKSDFGADGPAKSGAFAWVEPEAGEYQAKLLGEKGDYQDVQWRSTGESMNGYIVVDGKEVLVVTYRAAWTADGDVKYFITQLQPMKHDGVDALDIVVKYTLTDADGDYSTNSLTLTINDGAPTVPDPIEITFKESDIYANGKTAAEGLIPKSSFGADGPAKDGAFAWEVPTEKIEAKLLNGDGDYQAVQWRSTGEAMNGYIVVDGKEELVVTYRAAWTADGDVKYFVTQLHPMKHDGVDTLDIVVKYTLTDADGDTVPGTFKIAVIDDAPTAVNDYATFSHVEGGGMAGDIVIESGGLTGNNPYGDGISFGDCFGGVADIAALKAQAQNDTFVDVASLTGAQLQAVLSNPANAGKIVIYNGDLTLPSGGFTLSLPADVILIVNGNLTAQGNNGLTIGGFLYVTGACTVGGSGNTILDGGALAIGGSLTLNGTTLNVNAGAYGDPNDPAFTITIPGGEPIPGTAVWECNILGNDNFGADGFGYLDIADKDGNIFRFDYEGSVFKNPDGANEEITGPEVAINGEYGTLTVTLDPNGKYTHTYEYKVDDPGTIKDAQQEVFEYTLVDRDGSNSDAKLIVDFDAYNGKTYDSQDGIMVNDGIGTDGLVDFMMGVDDVYSLSGLFSVEIIGLTGTETMTSLTELGDLSVFSVGGTEQVLVELGDAKWEITDHSVSVNGEHYVQLHHNETQIDILVQQQVLYTQS